MHFWKKSFLHLCLNAKKRVRNVPPVVGNLHKFLGISWHQQISATASCGQLSWNNLSLRAWPVEREHIGETHRKKMKKGMSITPMTEGLKVIHQHPVHVPGIGRGLVKRVLPKGLPSVCVVEVGPAFPRSMFPYQLIEHEKTKSKRNIMKSLNSWTLSKLSANIFTGLGSQAILIFMFSPAGRQGCIVCLFASRKCRFASFRVFTSRLCMTGAAIVFLDMFDSVLIKWNVACKKCCLQPKPSLFGNPDHICFSDVIDSQTMDLSVHRDAPNHQADWTLKTLGQLRTRAFPAHLPANNAGICQTRTKFHGIAQTQRENCELCGHLFTVFWSLDQHTTPFSSRDSRWMLLALGAGVSPYRVPSQHFWTCKKFGVSFLQNVISLFLSLSLSLSFLTRDHAPAPGPLASPLSAPGRSTWPDSINVGWSIAQHPRCISNTCKRKHIPTNTHRLHIYIYINMCV